MADNRPGAKPKLGYVLPEAATNTHMRYNVEFVSALAKDVDIYLIIEKGSAPGIAGVSVERAIGVGGFARALATYRALLDARARGYTTVYVHYSFLAALLATFISGLDVYYWNCGLPWQYPGPWLRERFERLTYRRVDHFVTGAASLVPHYARYYHFPESKAVIVPNWIDVAAFEAAYAAADRAALRAAHQIPIDAPVLFYMQRLAERKGPQHLPAILAACPDAVLMVAGDGPYRSILEASFAKAGLSDRVRMLGRVPNTEMPALFKAADVFLLPSEEEGMPHALLEAMAAGVPAVVTDVGAVREMIPEAWRKYVARAGDTDALGEKTRALLADANERVAYGAALRAAVVAYDKQRALSLFTGNILCL